MRGPAPAAVAVSDGCPAAVAKIAAATMTPVKECRSANFPAARRWRSIAAAHRGQGTRRTIGRGPPTSTEPTRTGRARDVPRSSGSRERLIVRQPESWNGRAWVIGNFGRGEPVAILAPEGVVLGKGLVRYTSTEAKQIAGHRSGEIAAILGYPGRAALVHRDDMVI